MDNFKEPDWVYHFIKRFEYLVGTYALPIGLVITGTDGVMKNLWGTFIFYTLFFIFELYTMLMKEKKGDLTKHKVLKYEWQLLLFKCYGLVTPVMILQLLNFSWTALYLLIIPIGFWSKYLLLNRLKHSLD